MLLKTADTHSIKSFLAELKLPKNESHKGQNGRVLVIGGSSLFHAASLWAAEVSSHFVDMVHYASTKENEKIFLILKSKFTDGMVVPQKDLLHYIEEDDAVLVGPGMLRKLKVKSEIVKTKSLDDIFSLKEESEYTRYLTRYLIDHFPEKRFVFDAGALQMMDLQWLVKLREKPILTPHQKEFEDLFHIDVLRMNLQEKMKVVQEMAHQYRCVILLKAIDDIVSDGKKTYVVRGGNQGLTKGGTGDVLAGLAVSFFSKNDAFISAVLASYILKTTSDVLFSESGYWYNVTDIVQKIPMVSKKLFL